MFCQESLGGFHIPVRAWNSLGGEDFQRGVPSAEMGEAEQRQVRFPRKRRQRRGAAFIAQETQQGLEPGHIRLIYMEGRPPPGFHSGEGASVFQASNKVEAVPARVRIGVYEKTPEAVHDLF